MGPEPARVAPEEEWLGYFASLSNWGRWGPDDTRGTLNLVSPEKVVAACAAVREGRMVSCARMIEFGERPSALESRIPPLHFFSWTGARAPERGGSGSIDWLGIPLHGLYVTHVDAHAHAFWDGRMYNGRPASAVSAESGAREGSLQPVETGVVTRGVLLDVARALGVDTLPAGFAIGAVELEQTAAHQGVAVEPGDMLMVRTGYGKQRAAGRDVALVAAGADAARDAPHLPGLGVAALPWLHEHDVALVGTDTGTDARPSPYAFNAPVHVVAMCAMGMWIVDNLDLESLRATCGELGRWSFLGAIAPLRLKNATGSPVNPIAVF
jgi:kynurenine formamidase